MADDQSPLSQLAFTEAAIGILTAVIMADGKYTQDEFVWWKAVQNRHPLFRDVPPNIFNPLLRSAKARLVSQPWKLLVTQWATQVPAEARLPIFELAADLAVVDKELEGREPEVVVHLWHALEIPDDVARKVFMGKIEKM